MVLDLRGKPCWFWQCLFPLLEHSRHAAANSLKEYKACSAQDECSFPASQGVINKAGAFYIHSNSKLLNGKQRKETKESHILQRGEKMDITIHLKHISKYVKECLHTVEIEN